MYIKRAINLFVLSYVFLFIFPDVINYIPGIRFLTDSYTEFIRNTVLFFGREILQTKDLTFQENTGSGDTQFDYVRILLMGIGAVVIAVIGSFFVKLDIDKVRNWITIYARYYVGTTLVVYGISKFQGQFPVPSLYNLESKLGNMSPMGLLWNFMGHSYTYNAFTGIVEILAGYLLLFRKTSVLGALLGLAAMTQVWVLNMTYDVPVKINSFHYALFCVFIACPHLKNLFLFFFREKAVSIINPPLQFRSAKLAKALPWCKGFVIALYTFINVSSLHYLTKKNISSDTSVGFIPKSNVGIKVFYENENYGMLEWPNAYGAVKMKIDTLNTQILITEWEDSSLVYSVKYHLLSDTTVNLKGKIREDSISGVYKLKYKKDYLLNKTSFNWVREFPFNR